MAEQKMSAPAEENAQTPHMNDTPFTEILSTEDFVGFVSFLKQFMRNIPNGLTGIYKDGDYFRITYSGSEQFNYLHFEDGKEEYEHVDG